MKLEQSPLARDFIRDYNVAMSTTLRDFIAQRESEIKDQLKALKAELRDLQVAKGALEGKEEAPAKQASPTIKDMVRAVLEDLDDRGLTSQEILAAIKTRFDRELERTSLSPQLSRLKDSGDLILAGERWFTPSAHKVWVQAMGSIFGGDEEEEATEVMIVNDDEW